MTDPTRERPPGRDAAVLRRVLVVGAAGATGSAIVAGLAAGGHSVVAQVEPGERPPTGDSGRIAAWVVALSDSGPFTTEVPPAEVVVHARPVGEDDAPPELLQELSLRRFDAVASMLRQAGARRLVLVSGIEAAGPLDAEAGVRFEDVEPRPVIHVGGALLAAEQRALELACETGIELVILRAGHLYGRGMPGFLDRVLAVISGPDRELARFEWGNRRFQPVHVDDLAQAVAVVITQGSGIYHITDGRCPTIGDILRDLEGVARLKRLVLPPTRGPFRSRPGSGRVHFAYPPDRAMRELGFRPQWTLSRGMAALVDELQLQQRQKESLLAGFARLAFTAETTRAGVDAVFEQESRFWDAQEQAEAVLYDQPHDWAYDIGLGNVVQAPVYRFLVRALRHAGVRTVLDVGCGSGVYSRWLAKVGGLRAVGVDLSAAKIARARELAVEAGVGHLVDYQVGNILTWQGTEKVDAVCAFGALHHFPELEEHLPQMLERNLKPGGLLVAVEPHCEAGYHPAFLRFTRWVATTWWGRSFDVERYERVAGDAARGATLRGESPAGLHFHRDDFELDAWLRSTFEPVTVAHTHFLAPFVANAFVVYQKSRVVQRLTRWLMPLIVRLDGYFCRYPQFRRWAALGMYAMRVRAPVTSPPNARPERGTGTGRSRR